METKKKILNKFEKYNLIYSPRTTYAKKLEKEEILFNDLTVGFDPLSIKIIKKHFKEQLGKLNKQTFISILKRHLIKWHPNIPNREEILIKLLSRLFDEIDLNANGKMEWDEFTNYIIHSSGELHYNNALYRLKFYSISNKLIDRSDNNKDDIGFGLPTHSINGNDNVGYAFYIEKFNLIGIVQEGKAKIFFYDGETCQKKIFEINIKDTQNEIEKIEMDELNKKTEVLLEKEKKNQYELPKNIGHKKDSIINLLRVPTPQKVKKEIFDINNGDYVKNKKKQEIKTKNLKLTIINTIFIEEYDILLVSSSNNKITAWKFNKSLNYFQNVNSLYKYRLIGNNIELPILSIDQPVISMCFDNYKKKLYTGLADGEILIWELDKPKPISILSYNEVKEYIKQKENENNPNSILKKSTSFLSKTKGKNKIESELIKMARLNRKNIINFKEKRDTVSCLQVIDKLRLLCSAHYNGSLVLWDIILGKPKKIYCDQQTGIYKMCLDHTKNLIFTCGFEHNIYIYDPFHDDTCIYKLEGHNSSVNTIALNEYENELISLDIMGNIKIWDINNYYNFQSLNTSDNILYERNHVKKGEENQFQKKKISSTLQLLSIPKMRKILIYGDKFVLYEKGKVCSPDFTDDNFILGCNYNFRTCDIITISVKLVKFWSILTGKVRLVYENLMDNNEITSFCFDKNMKRLFLGDNNGRIKNFNLSTGSFIKEFDQHNKDVIYVFFVTKLNILVSISSDQILKFHSDEELLETHLVKEVILNPIILKSKEKLMLKDAILDDKNAMLILGFNTGRISIYDINHLRYDNQINEDDNVFRREGISSLCHILDIDLYFMCSDTGTKKLFVSISNPYYKVLIGEKFGKFINKGNISKNIIFASFYDTQSHSLFLGDNEGYLSCYDLTNVYNLFNSKKKENEICQLIKEIEINCKFNIIGHKQGIIHLYVPFNLIPGIIISTSTDQEVSIFYSNNGQYIDTLKQEVIQTNPVPIAIQFMDNNPFLEKVQDNNLKKEIKDEEIDNKKRNKNLLPSTKIIYRTQIENSLDKKNQIEEENPEYTNIYKYSNQVMENNAKEKLNFLIRGLKLRKNCSTTWKYYIDINHLEKINQDEYYKISDIVKKKDDETVKTEQLFQSMSIFNERYCPIFLKNLTENEKEEFNEDIHNKIRGIRISINKSKVTKVEREEIEKIELKSNRFNKTRKNIFLTPLSPLNSPDKDSKIKNLKSSSTADLPNLKKNLSVFTSPSEKRFVKFKDDFNKRILELNSPISELLHKKKIILKRILPKINNTNTNSQSNE